jgi:uncharacterized Zn-binding protein involved in type VI secretion
MKPLALVGDSLTCPGCPHPPEGTWSPTGTIVYGRSVTTLVSGKVPVVAGDLGVCGNPTGLYPSTARTFIGGALVIRVGDADSCAGLVTGPGSVTTLVG